MVFQRPSVSVKQARCAEDFGDGVEVQKLDLVTLRTSKSPEKNNAERDASWIPEMGNDEKNPRHG
jgi:hypothetical protein